MYQYRRLSKKKKRKFKNPLSYSRTVIVIVWRLRSTLLRNYERFVSNRDFFSVKLFGNPWISSRTKPVHVRASTTIQIFSFNVQQGQKNHKT